jgi:hypothetical protein
MGEAKVREARIASGAQAACENCRFYYKPRPAGGGVCRRNPPVPYLIALPGAQPVVKSFWSNPGTEDWCGEYQPRAAVSQIDWAAMPEVEGTA